MKKTLSLFLVLAMLLTGMTSILTACGSDDDGEVGADIHLFLSSRIYDFDPTMAIVDDDAAQILAMLYEPLFRLNKDGSVSPALAEDYEINKSARTMTITIRDTNWSDAKPVTSNDVAYAWKRILDPTFENPAATLLYDIKNALYVKQGADADGNTLTIDDLGVEAPDEKTLIITFRKEGVIDYDSFLRNLTSIALSPVPEDTVGIFTNSDNWSKQVATIKTNGPFTLKAIDHFETGEFALQRNRYYRRDKDSDTPLTEYVVPQFLSSVWATKDMTREEYEEAFLNSKITVHYAGEDNIYSDSYYYISDLPLDVRQAGTFASNIKESALLSVSTCVLNTKYGNPVLANKNIRLALSAAIDREDIAEELKYAQPATGFITPGLYNSGSKGDFRTAGDNLIAVKADMVEAEKLLAKGMEELQLTDKSQLGTLRLMYSGESINDDYTANAIAAAWTKLGFTVVLDPLYGEPRTVNDVSVADSALQMNYNAHWTDVRLTDADYAKAAEEEAARKEAEANGEPLPELTVDIYADAILIDNQMLTKDAFAALCAFSSTMSGNGFDMTDITEIFSLIECSNCKHSHVVDDLIKTFIAEDEATTDDSAETTEETTETTEESTETTDPFEGWSEDPTEWSDKQKTEYITIKEITCPDCEGKTFGDIYKSEPEKEYSYQPVPHVSGYTSADYDAKINAAFNAEKLADRTQYLHEAEELLLADMPVIPLIFNRDFFVISDNLTKVTVDQYGYPVFTKAYLKGYQSLELSPGKDDNGEDEASN